MIKKNIGFLTLGILLISVFIYRLGTVELSKTELVLYVVIALLFIFRKDIFKV